MVVKKWKAMFGKKMVISKPLSPPPTHSKNLYLRQLKNNQNQINTTEGQNLMKINNTAEWLSGFCNELIT
jgi:hypothetical protein